MRLAEQYLDAFGNIAKKGSTIVLPSNAGDASSMVAQATAIYQNLTAAAPSEADGEDESDGTNKPNPSGFKPEPITDVIRKLNGSSSTPS